MKFYQSDFNSIPFGILSNFERECFDLDIKEIVYPWDFVHSLGEQIKVDAKFLINNRVLKKQNDKIHNDNIIGSKDKILFFDDSPLIHNGVMFDTSEGEIVIDSDVIIYPFLFIKGPCYIGKNTIIKDARIYGGCYIGKVCKISGEMENCYIGNFSNKNHESSLLHSFIGDWNNIAGYSKTADLNIDYSNISVSNGNSNIDTGRIKFGCKTDDFVKIGGGVLIYPGTIFGFASTILDLPVAKGFYPSFYNKHFQNNKHDLDKFIQEVEIIMSRRDKQVSSSLIEKFNKIYLE